MEQIIIAVGIIQLLVGIFIGYRLAAIKLKPKNKKEDLGKCHHSLECIDIGIVECTECGKKFNIN